jgi:hypothetical protein
LAQALADFRADGAGAALINSVLHAEIPSVISCWTKAYRFKLFCSAGANLNHLNRNKIASDR